MCLPDATYVAMDYREKILQALDRKRMSKADLARDTKLGAPRFSKWFGGTGKPNLYQALKIARVLGVPLEFLADEEATELEEPKESPYETEEYRLVRRMVETLGPERAYRRLMKADDDEVVAPKPGRVAGSIVVKGEQPEAESGNYRNGRTGAG